MAYHPFSSPAFADKYMTAKAAARIRERWAQGQKHPRAYPVSRTRYADDAPRVRECHGRPVSVCNALYLIMTTDYSREGQPDDPTHRSVDCGSPTDGCGALRTLTSPRPCLEQVRSREGSL
jgi:hypothetical protein